MVRIAAVGDVHCNRSLHGLVQALCAEVAQNTDILLLCGDLIDYGLPEEAAIVAKELSSLKIPILAVLGNHEFECGKQAEVRCLLTEAGVVVLDGESYEINGIGFAGVKGFAGGFGERAALQPWGEEPIKQFVHEALAEALKLESALAKLRIIQRIVLLHYAPIQATVVGEPVELYPFLESSRLEEPLNRYPVSAVFHGHAHHGSVEGRTKGDVPVYNVAMRLLTFPERTPYRIVELPASDNK